MLLLRRLCPIGVAALAVCAVAAPTATATTKLHAGSTSGPLSSSMSAALRTSATLTGSFSTITCTTSTFKGSNTGQGSPDVNGTLDASGGFTMANCANAMSAPCTVTVTAVSMPVWWNTTIIGLGVSGTFDWSTPTAFVTFSGAGCLPGGATCSFGSTVLSGSWTSASGVADGFATFTNQAVAPSGAGCPASASFSASYNVRDSRTFATGAKLYLEGA